jgi:pimeloyl-ACP methyl ester carboxylesterase
LSTHVTDVVHHVLYEDLTDVVLVGFSYGGMVVTGALDAIGERVRALVYVDAFVPGDGDSAYGLLGVPPSGPPRPGNAWLVDGPARVYDDPAEEAFAVARRTPQPIACCTEPVRLSRPLEDWPFPRTHVRLTAPEPGVPPKPAFDAAAAPAAEDGRFRVPRILGEEA